jgi:hypothetical protein
VLAFARFLFCYTDALCDYASLFQGSAHYSTYCTRFAKTSGEIEVEDLEGNDASDFGTDGRAYFDYLQMGLEKKGLRGRRSLRCGYPLCSQVPLWYHFFLNVHKLANTWLFLMISSITYSPTSSF